ncbi:MAG: glycosyltransferase family 4 protein, partial [Proteobacteria bacterium]|nr:glycosyltransferase family 4 protein [Pseudomonadota bacterium]
MIVGYLSAFNEILYAQIPLGRFSANQSFVRALIEFSRAERIHLFFPNTFLRQKFRQVYDQASVKLDKVELFTFEAIPRQLAATNYTALHASDLSSFTPALFYLRNRYAPQTPLTAITHSLNYRQIYADYLRRLLPGAMAFDAIVATSRTAAEVVRRSLAALGGDLSPYFPAKLDYKGQVRRIPLGVDADWFRPRDRAAARDALGLPREAPIIVSLGRFSYRDKMDLAPLLRVLARLRKRMSNRPPILVLAGGDQEGYAAGLGRLGAELGLAGQLKLKPNLPEEKKADLYAAADVFVSPTDNVQETFGLTVIEAMACARPVVASDFDGYRDLVKDGQTGWLIPTVSAACHGPLTELSTLLPDAASQLVLAQSTAVVPEILEDRLHGLLHDPARAETMGRAGRKRVEEKFAWPRVIAEYE